MSTWICGLLQAQIAADVLDAGNLLELRLHQRRRAIQLRGVGVLQRELVDAARALLAAEVDRRLVDHEHAHARDPGDLRTKVGDDLIDRSRPLRLGLQVDAHAPLVQLTAAATTAAAADVVAEADDVGILGDDVGDFHLVPQHLFEADALDALDADRETILVFARQEPLRHDQEQIRRAGDEQERDRHRQRAMPQAEPQRPVVGIQPRLEHALGHVVEDAVALAVRRLQEAAAEHRRQADRQEAGDDDGDADRDGEFFEQPADQPAHEQDRDEDRDQRHRHRDDRECHFLRAVERRLHAAACPFPCAGRCSPASRSCCRRRSRCSASTPSATGCRGCS